VSQAAGWYRDPFHREQERYWDGRLWTQGTRPVGAEEANGSIDNHTNDRAERVQADRAGEADRTDHAPTSRGAGSAAGAAWDATSVPAPLTFAPLGAHAQPSVTVERSASPTMATHARTHRHLGRAAFGVSAAAVVLLVAGLSAVFALGGGTSGEASAAEAVVTAATQTINAHSADVSMSVDASATGMQESLTGSGAFDFAQKTGTMTMTIPVNGNQYSEQEILDGSTIYVNVSGLDTGLAPSQPWISVPVDQSDSTGSGISTLDAMALLHQLQTVGGAVTSLGQTGYDGTEATEYQATLPASALESEMGALPSSSGQNSLGLDLPDMTIDVYVTPDGLLKALVVPTYSFDIASETISVNMTLTFSNFGTPVNVTPPPADQVEPLSQLGGGLGNSGSTGNTGNSGTSGNSGTGI
jgi:hypothetical protein